MRHRLAHRKLNRNTSARASLLRGLTTELIKYGALETTIEKAKELRGVIEPLITRAKVDSVYNRRRIANGVYGKDALGKLFRDIAPANAARPGGYTRILRLGFRPGDNARRALIELVSNPKSFIKEKEKQNQDKEIKTETDSQSDLNN